MLEWVSTFPICLMVTLNMIKLTIMRILARGVDPMVFSVTLGDSGQVSFSSIGGLSEQICELRKAHGHKTRPNSFWYRLPQSRFISNWRI
jgi:ATP-dependent 26S proteasome regulatory subunit